MAQVHDDRSLGELFSELSRETSTLVRQEVHLAKVEMSETATKVGKNIAFIAAGGAVLYAGFLVILLVFIDGLIDAANIEAWLAALIVGLVVLAIGGFLVYRGYNQLKQVDMVPERTIETLKEDAEWAKRQVD
ncbi:MAG: phage holin family protein [Candidatus Promineifilaceae bacterium]|nr:phage holin family protein [Candidatus Promineifilaceae bacterium]